MGKSVTKKKSSSRLEAHTTVEDAAVQIGCCKLTVIRLLHGGELTGYRLTERGWWKVTVRSLDVYVSRLQAQAGKSQQKRPKATATKRSK